MSDVREWSFWVERARSSNLARNLFSYSFGWLTGWLIVLLTIAWYFRSLWIVDIIVVFLFKDSFIHFNPQSMCYCYIKFLVDSVSQESQASKPTNERANASWTTWLFLSVHKLALYGMYVRRANIYKQQLLLVLPQLFQLGRVRKGTDWLTWLDLTAWYK